MNYFKYSPLRKVAKMRENALSNSNTRIKQRAVTRVENLDIMEISAYRKRQAERRAAGKPIWKGGDEQDRLEYIQARKAELGDGIWRVLNKSAKHSMYKSYVSEDAPYLELTGFDRRRDISELWSGHDLQWSVKEVMENAEANHLQFKERAIAELRETEKELKDAVSSLAEGPEKDDEDFEQIQARMIADAARRGGGFTKAQIQRGLKAIDKELEIQMDTDSKQIQQ